ncbi:GNAT family N-acetyltransferase [Portibacter lacus]|nr:GNAT family N-acetyltransferase [Portibacter lacus]
MDIEFEEYAFATPFYALSVTLRDQVLRAPLGLEFKLADLQEEWKDIHLGAFVDDQLCACLVLCKVDEHTIKMRQVAVHDDMQGRGIGSKLVLYAEQVAKDRNYKAIILNARDTAVNFYKSLNYTSVGKPFTEVGIPHLKMKKAI